MRLSKKCVNVIGSTILKIRGFGGDIANEFHQQYNTDTNNQCFDKCFNQVFHHK